MPTQGLPVFQEATREPGARATAVKIRWRSRLRLSGRHLQGRGPLVRLVPVCTRQAKDPLCLAHHAARQLPDGIQGVVAGTRRQWRHPRRGGRRLQATSTRLSDPVSVFGGMTVRRG